MHKNVFMTTVMTIKTTSRKIAVFYPAKWKLMQLMQPATYPTIGSHGYLKTF